MKEIRFAKAVVFINGLVPLALMSWDFYWGKLGANPLEFVTLTTGMLTLVFLMLSLAVTPLRQLTKLQWLVRFRRMLGLYAFFYGFLHLTAYVWFDKLFELRTVALDVYRRPFIAVGMLSFFLMIPLAITSTDRMIKRLGGKRWQKLHRVAYLAAAGGVFHYWLLVKSNTRLPLAFALLLALLLGYRFVKARLAYHPPARTLLPPR